MMVFDELQHLPHLQATQMNHCMLLFFGTCDLQSGHVDITSGVLCIFSSGASQKKYENSVDTF
jgi:hypothetical protein